MRRDGAYPPLLLALCVTVALIAAIPLLFVVGYTVSLGWGAAWRLIVRPRVGELLVNTTELMLGCMILCAVLGTAAAWLVHRTNLPGRGVWHVLLAAPLAVPAFVTSFGWVSVTGAVEGYGGALLIVTLSYYPLVYLPVAATLRGLDPALEETARSLGLGSWAAFARVVLPQLRPAVLGGSLLVGLHLLAEFGALQMLRFPTFTTAIYDQYRSSYDAQAANMLAGVLVACCAVLLLAELRLRGRRRYARLGSGAARIAPPVRLGLWSAPALLAVLGVVVLALGVPLGSLARWLVVGASTAFPLGTLAQTAGTALGLGLMAALLTTLCAIPVAWLSVRHRGRVSSTLERSTYIGNALPGIVVALALITVSIRFVRPAYQTTGLLLIAYVIMFLPRAVVSVRAAVAQAQPVLDDVAHSLGAGTISRLRRVTLPLMAPGVGAGAALVFLAVVTELTATLLLSPTGTHTLATQFWSEVRDVDYGAAAPYAALMVLISAPATYLLTATARRST
ncbi:MAG: binding-protein-dependent transport system inner rane component [Sphaerisporangium sp.]|nr:binding-protein-dependent transport system inner rane component [Sphaerisporangium sp.]